jgi:Uma2 family endonuclease
MATAPPLLSIEEYLRTGYHPDADYVDGEIEERNVGEFEHATFQIAIGAWFWSRRTEWNIRPVTEQRIRMGSNRVRVCDVAILRGDAPRERVITTPPLICIEVLSPEDRLSRAKIVLADYFALGVPNIWLVDPIRRSAFTFGATGLVEADPTNLRVPRTAIHLDLTEAFAAID